MEAVRRARIDLELGGLFSLGECGLEGLDGRNGNAGICLAIETEYWRLHFGGELRRALRPEWVWRIDRRTVKRNAGFERAGMSGKFPHGSSATAKSDNPEPIGVAALRFRPGDCGIEIGKQLRVRLGVYDRQE